MNIRKEKEKEFYIEQMKTFEKIKVADPFFTIKTAFFKKGKYGRQVQFFEWELQKEQDIYIEFYDNVYENGDLKDIIPMNENRALFKHKHNPYFTEEYEIKESTNSQGAAYSSYVISVSELTAILDDGTEVTYNEYEKMKDSKDKEKLPQLQKSLSIFPDFDEKEKKEDAPGYVPWKEDEKEVKNFPEWFQALDRIASALEKIENKLNKK